jgi:hypothetical protein
MSKLDDMERQTGMSDKDYQPGAKEFAGAMMGKANQYMERKDKEMTKAASKIKSQAYSGNRYD